MSRVKKLCCSECGSFRLVWPSWVNGRNDYVNEDRVRATCLNVDCNSCGEKIDPILKSQFNKAFVQPFVTTKNHLNKRTTKERKQ